MLGLIERPRIDTGPFAFRGQTKTSGKLAFPIWLKATNPMWTWDWVYQQYIQRALQQVTEGRVNRLMLFLPPRHGKSEMVTVRYSAWRLENKPTTRVIVAAYNASLAVKFSRKIRRIVSRRIGLSTDKKAADDWETAADAQGQAGGVRAAGVGGGLTGTGADLIVIDDPVKSREEANSKVYRDKVYDWYTDDLFSRREPGCAIVLIMTRWHEDDLAGRILNSEDGKNWKVIKLPAMAEENDPLGRRLGEALCPARYDLPALEEIKIVEGKSWWGLYQQRPQEQEGSTFKRSWFERVQMPPVFDAIVRWWDSGATKDGGDYTAGVLIGKLGKTYYVVDVKYGQWSTGERDRVMRQTASEDVAKYPNVVQWREQEPGSAGKDTTVYFVQNMDGYAARCEPSTGDKVVRAGPLASAAEYGMVKVNKEGTWYEAWIDQLTTFPNGAHDDMVDGTASGFNKLTNKSGWGEYAAQKTREMQEQSNGA